MEHSVEPRLRCLVADQLGIDPTELSAEISLTDDLAADSLDLLELVVELESQFGITLPESLLDEVHRYGDLVDVVTTLCTHERTADAVSPLVWSRVVPEGGGSILERAGRLTPYSVEDIVDDALHAGPGARLEMSVPTTTTDSVIARLTDDLAWLEPRGIHVSVHRDRALDAAGPGPHPHAA